MGLLVSALSATHSMYPIWILFVVNTIILKRLGHQSRTQVYLLLQWFNYVCFAYRADFFIFISQTYSCTHLQIATQINKIYHHEDEIL